MKLIKIALAAVFTFLTVQVNAQVEVDLELRPRAEYRHGFRTLFPNNADAATFVSQRTRLKTSYTAEKLKLGLSIQDIRTWGDVPTLNNDDKFGSSVHEAWAELLLNPQWSVKVGRQEINLDDQRIFGAVNWVQQARSHDIALLKYNKNAFKMNFGLAFNQGGEALANTTYLVNNNYKAMQYLWLNKKWGDFSGSLLLLNDGRQFIHATDAEQNKTRFSQTAGTHLKYNKGKFNFVSNLYYQFGKDVNDNDLAAYLVSLEAHYKISNTVKTGLGAELISGNDNGAVTDGKNNAFNPLYGTNHKFNGLMDFFYVGNHGNNVGLLDVYLKTKFTLNEKSNLYVGLHNFSAAADYEDKQLGNEIDLVYAYKLQKDVVLKMGYSHLLPADGMETLKNNTDGNTNNLGWVMLVIKPSLFKSTK